MILKTLNRIDDYMEFNFFDYSVFVYNIIIEIFNLKYICTVLYNNLIYWKLKCMTFWQ